jgi:DNA-binding NtrC family response regulator
MPPLRERGNDVIEIAESALVQFAQEEGRMFDGLSRDVIDLFRRLAWPGNVRQVLNVIRNIVVLNDGGLVTTAMLPEDLGLSHEVRGPDPQTAFPGLTEPALDSLLGRPLAEVERIIVTATLARHGGSVPKAARVLELSPSTLYRKLETWAKTPVS